MKIFIVASLLLLSVILFGCTQPSSNVGCNFGTPLCREDQKCIDNICVDKLGCDYNRPPCHEDEVCVENQCKLKENPVNNTLQNGCTFNNPPCGDSYTCADNNCALKSGCSYGNPPCEVEVGQVCSNNACVSNLGNNIIASYPESGRVRIESENFSYWTYSEYEAKGKLEVRWLETCTKKLQDVLGISIPKQDKIKFSYTYGINGRGLTAANKTKVIIDFDPNAEQLSEGYNSIDETTKICADRWGEPRTAAHELVHGFSQRSHPFQEGLAEWGSHKAAGFERITCQENGFIWHPPRESPVQRDEFYNYSSYDDFQSQIIAYSTQYCFWKEIETRYGEATVRTIIAEQMNSKYIPNNLSFTSTIEEWDLHLREFLTKVVIPNTSPDFKNVLIQKFGLNESNFAPVP